MEEGTTRTEIAHFRVEGAFLTKIVRDLVCEGRWEDAIRLLVEDLEGMTWDLAVQILRGEAKLVGSSIDPEGIHLEGDAADDPGTARYLDRARSFYAGRFRDGENWYRPYAFVTDYGPCDVPSGGIASNSLHRAELQDEGAYSRYTKGWSIERMLFYADDRDSDRVGTYAFTHEGERRVCAVLFQRVNPPPVWWDSNAGSARKALDEWLAGGRPLDQRGAHQYDLNRPVCETNEEEEARLDREDDAAIAAEQERHRAVQAAQERKEREREQEEEDRQREEAYQARLATMRTAIEEQAGPKDGEGWLTLPVPAYHVWKPPEPNENGVTTFRADAPETCALCGKTFAERLLRPEDRACPAKEPTLYLVPRAPFLRWTLNRTHGAHLAPPWQNVAPPGWKLFNDDQDHSDWMIGSGLEEFYQDDAVRDASNHLSFEWQERLLSFKVHVLCGRGWVNRRALHPKPGETVPAGSIIVIPFAGPDYTVPATTAGPTGAIITERGGELAHLVTVGREQGLRLVRIPGALEKYPVGVRLYVNCDEGTVEVSHNDPTWDQEK